MPTAEKEPAEVRVGANRRARQIMGATGTGEKNHGGFDEIECEFGNGAGHELSSKPGAAIKRSARVKSMHLPEESIRATATDVDALAMRAKDWACRWGAGQMARLTVEGACLRSAIK